MGELLVGRALALYREGRFDEALEALERAIAADPNRAEAHCLRGIVLKDAGRHAAAVEAFDRAIAACPDLERVYYHRGTARFLSGEKQGALRDLERAVASEPDDLFAVYNLGVVAVANRDWVRAKQAFARCLALDPANRAEYVDLLVEIGRSAAEEDVYNQAHRLKNMIAVVGDHYRSLLAELRAAISGRAAEGVPASDPGPIDVHAHRIEEELSQVYRDMVQFLRAVDQEPPHVDLLDLRDVVDKCLFALSPRLLGITVEKEFAPLIPDVIGDRKALEEAIVNVLTNAVEACQQKGEPGRIRIRIAPFDAFPEIPGIDSVAIEVRDTGPGIPPERLKRIFEFGYTTKRFGSGLGLSYADRVVRAHGGRISVSSAPGEGACATIVLPASPIGAPNLRNLSLRSVLFEDLRLLAHPDEIREELEPRLAEAARPPGDGASTAAGARDPERAPGPAGRTEGGCVLSPRPASEEARRGGGEP